MCSENKRTARHVATFQPVLRPIITNRVHKGAVSSASGQPLRDGGSAKLVLGLGEEGGKSVSRGYFRQELHH